MGLLQGDRADTLGAFTSLPTTRWLAEYFLDISELPIAPSYWRINGSNTSILDAISQLLTDAGYDYYLELVPVRDVDLSLSPSGIAKFVKFRTEMKDWRACVRTWEMREKKKPMKTSKIDSQINEYLKGKEYL